LEGTLQKINEIDVRCLSFFCTSNSPSAGCRIFNLIQSGVKQPIGHDKLIVSEVISALKHVSYD